ncbi:MAG: ABC transporter permease [Gemmatimonadetes bacterium]|nr:ABC transporter permease [Gemmatimonadota bacterium]
MEQLVRDTARSLRLLAREKTFSGTVLVTLALCLGANVAIFGVVNAVLLEPLPFRDPGRLVTVNNSYPGAGVARASNGSVDFFQRREKIPAFEQVAVYQGSTHTVGEPGSTESVTSMRVSASFFTLLGVEPAMGRGFLEEETAEGSDQKVVLTAAAWRDWFDSAPDVLGRTLRMDESPFEVVGVLGEDFRMPERAEVRVIVPIPFTEESRQLDSWHRNSLQMIARLAPGATVEQAVAQNLALNDALIDEWNIPNARQLLEDAGFTTLIAPTAADLVRDVRPLLFMLWGGVAFVLLIGCVNIANLLLARAQTRVTEVATRLALGASRRQVAREMLTEAVVLGLIGGGLGLWMGALGLRLLETLGSQDLPRGTEIGVDGAVLLFTLLLSLAAAVLFAAIPVVSLMRGDLSPAFRAGGRTGTASRRSVAVRNALVTSQVALAFVMLIGAGLMLMSFRSALAVDPGFEPEGVLTGFVSLPESGYEEDDDVRQLWDDLLAEVRAIPGVDAASVTTQLPFTGNNSASIIQPEGYVMSPGESLLAPFQTFAGPDYFETMGIQLTQGRTFEEADGPDATRAVVIDEWLANRYWPEGGALGSRMIWGAVPGTDSIPPESIYTIVGIVETVKQNDLTTPDAEHVGAYYFTYRQAPQPFMTLTVRAPTGDPAALTPELRRALASLDPDLPLFGVETMQERLDESLVRRRAPLVVLGIFAVVALFLAVVGIYGALAYTVSQRTREIGIRVALGSAPRDVFRAVVGQGLRVTALGLVLGGVAAYLLARLIQSLLFEVQATDARVMVAVALVLGLVAALACMIPARRATRVSPVEALGG